MTNKKKILSMLLSAAVTLTMTSVPLCVPLMASAESLVTTTYDLRKDNVIIKDSGNYIITGASTGKNTISVESGSPNITVKDVYVEEGKPDQCAFYISPGADVHLTLEGNNTIKSGANCAGIQVPKDATLTITSASTGSLTVTGGANGAGIGGGDQGNCGDVNINGGTVTTNGGSNSVGIGGGQKGDGGNVTITGSGTNVTATGYNYDIGAGYMKTGCGGNLTVGDENTTMPLPYLKCTHFNGADTNTYNNCVTVEGTDTITHLSGKNSMVCDISNSTYYIEGDGNYIITGNSDKNSIWVDGESHPNITLRNANIDVRLCAFFISPKASVNLTLEGKNTLACNYYAGLHVSMFGSLTITAASTGSLTATSKENGAGIGDGGIINIKGGTVTANGCINYAGIACGNSSTINISGGTVTANGGEFGAGIGSGCYDNCGTINISGGTVIANGGSNSAGIGGGLNGNGGNVTITGSGTHVTAKGQNNNDIGSGTNSTDGGSLTIGGANTVKPLPYVQLASVGTNAKTTYKNCVIADSTGNPSSVYDANGQKSLLYDISKDNVSISDSSSYIVTGKSTTNKISVTSGSPSITLDDANIDVSGTGGCAFAVSPNSSVNVVLEGKNTIKSGANYAGLQVPDGATLTITETSTGTLNATGGKNGAGIGGGNLRNSGTINIKGGTVTANSIEKGAGIGGGSYGDGGIINISGGIVTANSSDRGAGIGGGIFSSGGTINISGGTVTAKSSKRGAGIGSGYGGDGGNVTITGSGTCVTAEGQGGGYDIGSGPASTEGGSLTVGDTNATSRLPYVDLLSGGTNAAPSFKNCVISNAANSRMSGIYDVLGNIYVR